ncbi:MAG: nicotinamide mononucleotide transporter [Bacteroidales bacterium]|nr:nicotinamide mononucleotide transporter [Bacteroidales bacterium]
MNILDILGAAIGLVYVFSEYRASRWFWPSSLLMAAFYAVINFRIGWYANTGICVYNFVMSVYGLLVWRGVVESGKRKAESGERPIGSCPARYWPWLILATAALTVAFRFVLALLGETTMPWLDGAVAALGIVGMWMLAQKYWQQWLFWLVSEPLLVYIYLSTGYPASAAMYAVYEVFCIMGIIRWRKLRIEN